LVSTIGSIDTRLKRFPLPWIIGVEHLWYHPAIHIQYLQYKICPTILGSKNGTLRLPTINQLPIHSHQLATIGGACGKLTLLQRYDLDFLSAADEPNQIGIDLSPDRRVDNGKGIVHNQAKNEIVYIKDFYNIELDSFRSHPGRTRRCSSKSDFVTLSSWSVMCIADINLPTVCPRWL